MFWITEAGGLTYFCYALDKRFHAIRNPSILNVAHTGRLCSANKALTA